MLLRIDEVVLTKATFNRVYLDTATPEMAGLLPAVHVSSAIHLCSETRYLLLTFAVPALRDARSPFKTFTYLKRTDGYRTSATTRLPAYSDWQGSRSNISRRYQTGIYR